MNIGFIGGGALAEALIKGIADKVVAAKNIFVTDIRAERLEQLRQMYHIETAASAEVFLDKIDILILAVKPKDAISALESIAGIDRHIVIVSVIAGFPIDSIEYKFPAQPVIRVMPNVAISVGEGMAAIAGGNHVDEQQLSTVKEIWSAIGRSVIVDEHLMDAVTGLSGSGPAFVFLMIDALSDGGVLAGLPRGMATELAAQTVLGAAKMVLEGGHPDVLRDKVTSPAGTTIEGIRVLERAGVRSAFIEAVAAATDKSKSLRP